MKKNNTAEKAILNAQEISKALKESTEKTLKNIVNESLKDLFVDDEEEEKKDDDVNKEDTPVEDDSYDVEDLKDDDSKEGNDRIEDADTEKVEVDTVSDDADGEKTDDSDADVWSEIGGLEKFDLGDGNYDITGEDGETALKVYSKLSDGDDICITKKEDGTYEMKDGNTGAEYVIELDKDGEQNDDEVSDEDISDEGDLEDVELDSDNEEDSTQETNDENSDDEEIADLELDDEEEGEDDDLNKELTEESLGYTDNYQKDVFKTDINMKEPADKNATYSMDGGAPQGSEKPYAKSNGDDQPFDETIEEGTNVGGAVQQRSMSKSHIPDNRKEYGPKVKHNVSAGGEYTPEINESIKKLIEKAKEIQAENKKYKEAIVEIKKSLTEAAILNVNYANVVKLLVNESTTKEEKQSILDRFTNVKTIKEGKELYNTIKKELSETKKTAPIVEKKISAEPSKNINETTIYADNPSIRLMERMDNLYKNNQKTIIK